MEQWIRERRYLLMLVALILLVLLVGGNLFISLNQRKGQQDLVSRVLHTNSIVEQWRTADSIQHTLATTNYVTKEQLKEARDPMIDSLRRELSGSIKTLYQATKLMAETSQRIQVPVRDTIVLDASGQEQTARLFSYSDTWMPSLKGMLVGNVLSLDYQIRNGFALEYHWKPTGLFKPKELELIVRSENPHTTVGQIQNFTVIEPVKGPMTTGGKLLMAAATGLIVGVVIAK